MEMGSSVLVAHAASNYDTTRIYSNLSFDKGKSALEWAARVKACNFVNLKSVGIIEPY